MIELKDLVSFLDKELDIKAVKDHCENGLQIEGNPKITNIGVAVDITQNTIKKAAENKCDIIISHHALIWGPVQKLTGLLAKNIELLMKNSISVYSAHHPIDIHKKYSHGKLIADELGLYGVSGFGLMDNDYFGFSGNFRKKVTLEFLKSLIDKKLNTDSRIFAYGKKDNSSMCIISGGGGFAVEEAAGNEIDCYITGEMKHSDLLKAKDLGINVILAGHYETEKLGMIKLSRTITKKFKTQCFFLES